MKTEFPGKDLYELIYFISMQLESFIRRRQSSKKIQQSEERYRALVELAPDIIYSVDSNGNIQSLNEAYERLTKIDRQTLIGKPFIDLIHHDDKEFVEERLKTNLKKRTPVAFSARLNSSREDDFIYGEVRTRNKLGIIVDLTDHYNLEKQKDLWFGVATHELKTPLTSIKAFAQLLLLNESLHYKEYLENINEQVDRMTDLINELLDITRITNSTFEINKSLTDVNALVEKVISLIQPVSKHKITSNLCPTIIFNVDGKRFTQVVTNLISNAIKYSPDSRKIRVETKVIEKNFVFTVTDYGIGIPKSDLHKIFNLFYRSQTKHAGKTPGLGIGLYISKTIVNLHGGKIWVDSKIGEGSTFHFSLPMG